MEFNDVVNRRYSCRAFAAQGVEQEKVDRILEAGRMAPPAVNKQPDDIAAILASVVRTNTHPCVASSSNVEAPEREFKIEENPSVGIFWYDFASHSLFGVRKQEVTPSQIETAACDGLPFIIYPETNEDVWQQEMFPGDYARTPRGRVSWVINKFIVLVGEWARPVEAELSLLVENEFALPCFEFVFDRHF